ncbi:MAG: sulfatase [Pleurocapsa minor GSE-CHR-MK-17-07R]|jgi:uncharacterized sulfatase|nr:sulfatase [Pleurocapsa minor GSE-CHR-MK 17-07R]
MHNILLIVLDTLRRDRLSAYGHARETSPGLDAFAGRGTRYTRAVAPAQWTIPAHASLFTGTLPSTHHVTQSNSRLSADLPTLAEQLRAAGWHTAAFCNNPLVGVIDHGLQRGFDGLYNYASAVPHRPFDDRKPWLRREFSRRFRPYARRIGNQFALNDTLFRLSLHPLLTPIWTRYINFKGNSANSIGDVIDYLEMYRAGGQAKPFFGFINLMGAHLPYRPAQDAIDHVAPHLKRDKQAYSFMRMFNGDGAAWASPPEPPLKDWQQQALLDFYDAEIFAQDQQLTRLFAWLEASGMAHDTTVIVTADHGEGHGEHDLFGHGFDVFQELTHVPLIITGERFAAGATEDAPASTRRLYHTVLDIAGILPADEAAQSLARTGDVGAAAISEAFAPNTFVNVLVHRNPSVIERMALRELRRCVVDGDYKLMLTGDRPTALYNIAADPAETRNLLTSQPERAAALHRLISPAQADDQSGASAEQDAAVLEHLRVLGYVD